MTFLIFWGLVMNKKNAFNSIVFASLGLLLSSQAVAASCAVVGGSNGASTSSEQAPKINTKCPTNMRREVSLDEAFPHKRTNPYAMDCDLGFNLPGFEVLFGMGNINFCSVAQTIAGPAAGKWNEAMSDVDKWSNVNVNVDPNSGCVTGPNGMKVCDSNGGVNGATNGAANAVDKGINGSPNSGGGSSSVNNAINEATKEPTFEYANGFPIYKPPYTVVSQ